MGIERGLIPHLKSAIELCYRANTEISESRKTSLIEEITIDIEIAANIHISQSGNIAAYKDAAERGNISRDLKAARYIEGDPRGLLDFGVENLKSAGVEGGGTNGAGGQIHRIDGAAKYILEIGRSAYGALTHGQISID